MKTAFQIALSLIALLSALRAEDKPTFDCIVGGRSIKVFFADQEFDATKHKIEHKEGAYLVGWELRRDGKHVMIDPSKLHQPPS